MVIWRMVYSCFTNIKGFSHVSSPSKGPSQASSLVPNGWSLPRSQLLPSVLSPELDLAFGRRRRREPPPRWLAELLSDVVTALGPRGVEFAKGSIDRDLASFR